jgi:hypothetical protein
MLRTLKALAACIAVGGLLAIPSPAQATETYPTFSLRACAAYPGSFGEANICLKVYVKKQEDGTGVNLKNHHIYMWTSGQGAGCGSAFNNPATNRTILNVKNSAGNIQTEHDEVVLDDGNDCDRNWSGDIGSQGTVVTWYFTPHFSGRFDNGQDVLRVWFQSDGDMKCVFEADMPNRTCESHRYEPV